jgi:hypothetical protein
MSMTMEESMKYRESAVHDLFLHANAALFELHRHVETEFKDEVWRDIYGMRIGLSGAENGIKFRHFTKHEPIVSLTTVPTEGETPCP